MPKITPVFTDKEIPSYLKDTPFYELFSYHNLRKKNEVKYEKAKMLICMCMDNRKRLHIPENFAYVLRTGGGNVNKLTFKVSFAISRGVQHIALIAHNNCGMVNLLSKRNDFIDGLVKYGGIPKETAAVYFDQHASDFEIGDEVTFTVAEAKKIHNIYPKTMVVPLLYRLEDNKLYIIESE